MFVDMRAMAWWGPLGYCFPDEETIALLTAPVVATAGRALASSAARQSDGVGQIIFDAAAHPDVLNGVNIPCVGPFHQYYVCLAWALEFNFGVNSFYTETGPGQPIFLNGFRSPFQVSARLGSLLPCASHLALRPPLLASAHLTSHSS